MECRKAKPDVAFVCCNGKFELPWLMSTMEQCVLNKLDIVVISRDPLPVNIKYKRYNISLWMLQCVSIKVIVTAASGIKKTFIPKTCKFTIHMPHSMISFSMGYPKHAFDGYNVIFACGNHHVKESALISQINMISPIICKVGYPKFDHMQQLLYNKTTHKALSFKKIQSILIAPSWGKDNILDTLNHSLINALIEQGFKVILRPHPHYFISRKNVIDELIKKFKNEPLFSMETSLSISNSILHADLMISDYSGIALEYSFLRLLPVLFVNVPPKVKNSDWKSIGTTPVEIKLRENLGIIVEPNIQNIIAGVHKIQKNILYYRKKIQIIKNDFLYNKNSSALQAAKYIKAFATNKYSINQHRSYSKRDLALLIFKLQANLPEIPNIKNNSKTINIESFIMHVCINKLNDCENCNNILELLAKKIAVAKKIFSVYTHDGKKLQPCTKLHTHYLDVLCVIFMYTYVIQKDLKMLNSALTLIDKPYFKNSNNIKLLNHIASTLLQTYDNS